MTIILKIFCYFTVGIFIISAPPISFSSNEDCNKDIESFLNCNNPRVMNYLLKLSKKDSRKVIKGVTLTNGTTAMKGYTFLGEAKGLGKGIHLYIFEFENQRSAYTWVDESGTELSIPRCPETVSFESAYVLSGDVYTWKAVQPRHGIVHVMCMEDSWLKKIE